MYKRDSQNLQHAHRVNAPLPTGGYIGDHAPVEDDFIPSAANLSREECEAEQHQLALEVTRAQADLAARRAEGARSSETYAIGLRIQVLIQRKSLVNKRHKELVMQDRGHRLGDAVRVLCDPELAKRIFAYANGLTDIP